MDVAVKGCAEPITGADRLSERYQIFGAMYWIFSQFLSATIVLACARVSTPRITPSLNLMPTMVVPVEGCRSSLNHVVPSATPCSVQNAPLVIVKLEPTFRITDSRHSLNQWMCMPCRGLHVLPKKIWETSMGKGFWKLPRFRCPWTLEDLTWSSSDCSSRQS